MPPAVPSSYQYKEFESSYDLSKLIEAPHDGKAAIDAFFTAKGDDFYAILPRWPGREFVVKSYQGAKHMPACGTDLRDSARPPDADAAQPQ